MTSDADNETENTSSVDVTVRNAEKGKRVSVNVSRPVGGNGTNGTNRTGENVSQPADGNRTVSFDEIEFTPERDGNFSLDVTQSTERVEGIPEFNRSDATEPVGFLQIEHNMSDEEVSNVTIQFRVRRETIERRENTEPNEVALYRFENTTYDELPTRLDRTTETHFVYVADSPGLSDFATGIKQARFRIADATVDVTRIRTGDDVEVLVRVTNTGSADGTYELDLRASNETIATRDLTVAPNGTRQTVFEEAFDRPATYELFVNDRFVANLEVAPEGGSTATATAADDGDDTPTADGSGTDEADDGGDGDTPTADDGAPETDGSGGATGTTTTGLTGFGLTTAIVTLVALAGLALLARRE